MSRRAERAPVLALALVVAVLLPAAGCGIPGLPPLPDPGTRPPAPQTDEEVETDEVAAILESAEPGPDCFRRHLRDAISLNQRRLPVYAEWSDGASEGVSRRLISLEREALIAAWYMDSRARRFQEAGVPIGCAEFVSMSWTPALETTRPASPSRDPGPGLDADSLSIALRQAYGDGGFRAVASVADVALAELAAEPAYHCMARHIIESAWRVAILAPHHAATAEAAGVPTPAPLSELLLRFHLAALPDAAALDAEAAPLQRAGVPILCRDVPRIR